MYLMSVLVLTMMPMALVSAQNGAYFIPKNRIYTSYSSWVVTMTVDLSPWQTQLSHLVENINALKGHSESFFTRIKSEPLVNLTIVQEQRIKQLEATLQTLMTQQIQQMTDKQTDLTRQLDSILNLITTNGATRSKRALLPIFGDILSSLFGTATSKGLDALKKNILKLGREQKNIVHVVESSLTLINKTHVEVKENRKAIRELFETVEALEQQVTFIITRLESGIHTELMLTQMSAKFQHVFQILSNTQGSLEAAMLQLHLQVDQALQGRIPSSLINTDTLRNTLKQIQSNCPTTLTLPMKVDHAKFLNWYYRHLPVLVIPGRSVFYLVTVFPLVQPSDSYQLYQAVTVPVSSNTSSLAATYKLESNTIGIAKDKAHYIYLTDAETMKCEADEVSYCRTQVPAMSIANAPSCAVALFQNNKRGVRKRCKTILKDDSRTPKVKHLFAGRWVVSANE